jgi:hypothetical protein
MASSRTPRELQEELRELINEFFGNESKLKNSVCFIGDQANNVAKLISDNEIRITPDIGYSNRVNSILTNKLHLDASDFTRTNQGFTQADDFTIKSDQFNKVKQSLTVALVEQRRKMEEQESITSTVRRTPPAQEMFIGGRTPQILLQKLQEMRIPGWDLGKITQDPITRFTQSTNRDTFIDIDRAANKISSNGTSIDAFNAMITAFQNIYGKDTPPIFTLSAAANTLENRQNCKNALSQAGYDKAVIDKVIAPLSSSASKPSSLPDLHKNKLTR